MPAYIRRPIKIQRGLRSSAALGQAWADATGESIDNAVMALIAVPGYQALENGALLGEAEDDHLMKL